ncbi:hypothetical protein [Gallibacterium sp. AGMB14963]|uniref:hypothetical protein n=1 Tax=Gallibacterium faecale TaxID=3019086 RepID=UPI0022F15FC7|nr:hypothetical protein [Gallibacterium sp. AGMB14963]MDA3977610.1 hypothetical protein [Gallibacterium sp. AGMB14963]
MKKQNAAKALLASILVAATPQQEQMNAVNKTVESIQELTFNQAQSCEVITNLNLLKQRVAMLNSFLAADKFRVNHLHKDLPDLINIRDSVQSVVVLVRNYLVERKTFSEYKNELRAFSNEVFKLNIALGNIKNNHKQFNIVDTGISFNQNELENLITDSNKVHSV